MVPEVPHGSVDVRHLVAESENRLLDCKQWARTQPITNLCVYAILNNRCLCFTVQPTDWPLIGPLYWIRVNRVAPGQGMLVCRVSAIFRHFSSANTRYWGQTELELLEKSLTDD